MAHVHPACLDSRALGDADPNADLGLEQDAAAELDLVVGKILELLVRAVVDGDPDSGPDVDAVAKLRGQAHGSVARVARGVQGSEDVRLQRRVTDAPAAIAELEIGPIFD